MADHEKSAEQAYQELCHCLHEIEGPLGHLRRLLNAAEIIADRMCDKAEMKFEGEGIHAVCSEITDNAAAVWQLWNQAFDATKALDQATNGEGQ